MASKKLKRTVNNANVYTSLCSKQNVHKSPMKPRKKGKQMLLLTKSVGLGGNSLNATVKDIIKL